MNPDKKLIHINDPALRKLFLDPETQGKYFMVKTVPVERRFLQSLIDLIPIVFFFLVLGNDYAPRAVYVGIYLSYYFFAELLFGTTPGKKVMKHVIVNASGNTPGAGTIFLRSLARLIPFEPFSCLGDYSYGIHDRLSGTYVITEAEYYKIHYTA